MSNLEQAAKGKYGWIPGASDTWNQVREYQMRAFIDGWTDCASYQSQNSVSKEHYDELKLNYDIMVEENKRLNERERELVEALQEVSDAYENPTSETRFKVALYKAKQVLSNHKK